MSHAREQQMSKTEDLNRFLDFRTSRKALGFPQRYTLHNLWINIDRAQEVTFGDWDFSTTHDTSLLGRGKPFDDCSPTATVNAQPAHQGRARLKIYTTAELMDEIWAEIMPHEASGLDSERGGTTVDAVQAKIVPPKKSAGTKDVGLASRQS